MMTQIERDVLNALQSGPLKLAECQSLRIAPTTLKGAVWSLRKRGHVIHPARDPDDTKGRNVYTMVKQ